MKKVIRLTESQLNKLAKRLALNEEYGDTEINFDKAKELLDFLSYKIKQAEKDASDLNMLLDDSIGGIDCNKARDAATDDEKEAIRNMFSCFWGKMKDIKNGGNAIYDMCNRAFKAKQQNKKSDV